MNESAISWTTRTWNPTLGCSRVTNGCKFCYAEKLATKRGWTEKPWTKQNEAENVLLKPHKLIEVYSTNPGERIFVNSMSDLFHEQIPDWYRAAVFAIMLHKSENVFQVLTKRPENAINWHERYRKALKHPEYRKLVESFKGKRGRAASVRTALEQPIGDAWGENIWMGTSVEDERVIPRIRHLQQVPAKIRFISAEPLLGPYPKDTDLSGIHWVIVGGESGDHMEPDNGRWMKQEWARGIRDLCLDQGVAFFYKQDSAKRTEVRTALQHDNGDYCIWNQYPNDLTYPVFATASGKVAGGDGPMQQMWNNRVDEQRRKVVALLFQKPQHRYKGAKGIRELFAEFGKKLTTCSPLDKYRGGKTANYFVEFEGFGGFIWVDEQGYIKNTPESIRKLVDEATQSPSDYDTLGLPDYDMPWEAYTPPAEPTPPEPPDYDIPWEEYISPHNITPSPMTHPIERSPALAGAAHRGKVSQEILDDEMQKLNKRLMKTFAPSTDDTHGLVFVKNGSMTLHANGKQIALPDDSNRITEIMKAEGLTYGKGAARCAPDPEPKDIQLPKRQIEFLQAIADRIPVVKNGATRYALRNHGYITLTDDWNAIELTSAGKIALERHTNPPKHTITIHTAQMGVTDPDMIDTTVKSASTMQGKALAPTWDLVQGHKKGYRSDDDYRQQYLELLNARYSDKGKWYHNVINNLLRDNTRIVLKCYCGEGKFCHRHLAAEWLQGIGKEIGVEVIIGDEISRKPKPDTEQLVLF